MTDTDTCPDTPIGFDCVVCGREGSYDFDIDSWYPQPGPYPEPVGPFYTVGRVLFLLLIGFLLVYLATHVL